MSEQRLIDANAFLQKMMQTNRYFSVKFDILEAPTIDPETLPIVRQLREQLARVTAEKDAAIKDIEAAMGSESTQNILKYLCSLCQNKDLNRGCTCDGKCAPKWRGKQKGGDERGTG